MKPIFTVASTVYLLLSTAVLVFLVVGLKVDEQYSATSAMVSVFMIAVFLTATASGWSSIKNSLLTQTPSKAMGIKLGLESLYIFSPMTFAAIRYPSNLMSFIPGYIALVVLATILIFTYRISEGKIASILRLIFNILVALIFAALIYLTFMFVLTDWSM